MKDNLSILLVDDHPLIRDAIKMYFDSSDRISVEGQASNGKDAMELLEKRPFDIVITDIVMPKMNGIELMTEIKTHYPEQKVIILSMVNETSNIRKMLTLGAKGYILKNCPKEEVLKAVDHVSSGKTYYDKEVFDIMVDDLATKPGHKPKEETPPLSKREIEVLKMILEEKSNTEIADALFISQKTVGAHKQHMMKKTKSKTLAGLIIYAVENDLLNQ